MKYISTRGGISPLSIRESLDAGLAQDGGLLVPEKFPARTIEDFKGLESSAQIGAELLKPFFEDDPILGPALPEICRKTFDFPIPLTSVPRAKDFILELFHGPTSAFKDVGARFLANCFEVLARADSQPKKRTVIVATSGDTGGAVASAFFAKPSLEVVILFPKGKISSRQESQLCAWGGNVRAFSVNGNFDDCQRMVKETLLQSHATSEGRIWLSANSINLGRILPQMIYYAFASLQCWRSRGVKPGFIIPSGNLGNSLAALWAKKMGLPIGPIHLALNANRGVVDFLKSGKFSPAPTLATLANAMDVGNPSNLERLRALYPVMEDLRADVSATSIQDEEIREAIRTSEQEWGQVLCPHSATAAVARKRFKIAENQHPWILVATAHPAKFESIVEPLIGHAVEVPAPLQEILKRPSHSQTIEPSQGALMKALQSSPFP